MPGMTIGALAKAGGVNVETVRYYQRRGLLAEPARPAGSVRRYGTEAADRLAFIRRSQELGFTLQEVSALLGLAETPNCRGARGLAASKLVLVERRIRDLGRMRRALRVLIRQCDARGNRSCPIVAALARGPKASFL